MLRFATSDPDGRVIYIGYAIECRNDSANYRTGGGARDPGEDWVDELDSSHPHCYGVCVLRAKAVDDDGAVTVAPEITITLHP